MGPYADAYLEDGFFSNSWKLNTDTCLLHNKPLYKYRDMYELIGAAENVCIMYYALPL